MDPLLVSVFQSLAQYLILAVVGLVVYLLRNLLTMGLRYLELKLGREQLEALRSFASMAVRTLQQSPVYETLDPARKKELAIVAVTQYARERGIPLTEALCDKVIEEAVQMMKAELLPVLSGEVLAEVQGS